MKLKNKKACFFDSISNDQLSFIYHVRCTTKAFNHVLHRKILPMSWTGGYINPLFKITWQT